MALTESRVHLDYKASLDHKAPLVYLDPRVRWELMEEMESRGHQDMMALMDSRVHPDHKAP